jgi:hypothetical protein
MHAAVLLVAILVVLSSLGVEVDPISVRVEQTSGNASNRFKHSQSKALKVHISNGSTADASSLRVKYFYFGRSVKDAEARILKQGESKANVPSHATVTVATPEIESVYTEEHGQRVDGKGGRGAPSRNFSGQQKDVRYKTVEATGTKLTGYGVQVFSGDRLVAETFSEPNLKSNLK